MDNFDTQWDNFDIDSLDIDTASKKTTVKPTVADKKAKAIIDKREINQNIDLDYDKFLDYDNPEGDQTADNATKFRKLIQHYENNFKRTWAKKADEFNYEMSKTKEEYQTAVQSNSPEVLALRSKLNELNMRRKDLMDWAKSNIDEVNYIKGKACGFITPDNVDYYDANPNLVRAELATGKYEYKPTSLK